MTTARGENIGWQQPDLGGKPMFRISLKIKFQSQYVIHTEKDVQKFLNLKEKLPLSWISNGIH